MRKSCISCVLKHLSQAMVLETECVLGYPSHKWWVIGHLAEAESECVGQFPSLAEAIRVERKSFEQTTGYSIDFDGLLDFAIKEKG